MSLRRTVLVVSLLVLPFVFGTAAASAARAPAAPKAPTNLRITASSPISISLAWDAASSKSSNWWYCIQRDGQGCVRVDPPKTTFTFPNLWPGTTFNYSVIAIDANGSRSAPSNTVTFTTPPDTAPPSAPTLSVTGLWPTRAALAWTQSTDNTSQVFATLLVDGSPSFSGQLGYLSFTVLRLVPQTTHTFRISVRDFFGNTAESNAVTVTTPAVTDRTPPSVPQNLRLSMESSIPEIWLDWDQSTDDTDPPSLIMYEVFLNGVLDQLGTTIGSGDTITYCQGAGPNAITVRAVDTSGNASGFSNAITFC
jgi:chitodextrinase